MSGSSNAAPDPPAAVFDPADVEDPDLAALIIAARKKLERAKLENRSRIFAATVILALELYGKRRFDHQDAATRLARLAWRNGVTAKSYAEAMAQIRARDAVVPRVPTASPPQHLNGAPPQPLTGIWQLGEAALPDGGAS